MGATCEHRMVSDLLDSMQIVVLTRELHCLWVHAWAPPGYRRAAPLSKALATHKGGPGNDLCTCNATADLHQGVMLPVLGLAASREGDVHNGRIGMRSRKAQALHVCACSALWNLEDKQRPLASK